MTVTLSVFMFHCLDDLIKYKKLVKIQYNWGEPEGAPHLQEAWHSCHVYKQLRENTSNFHNYLVGKIVYVAKENKHSLLMLLI